MDASQIHFCWAMAGTPAWGKLQGFEGKYLGQEDDIKLILCTCSDVDLMYRDTEFYKTSHRAFQRRKFQDHWSKALNPRKEVLCQSVHMPKQRASEGKGDCEGSWIVLSLILRNFCLSLEKRHLQQCWEWLICGYITQTSVGKSSKQHCWKVDGDTGKGEVPSSWQHPPQEPWGPGTIWNHKVARETTEIPDHLCQEPGRLPAVVGWAWGGGVPSISSSSGDHHFTAVPVSALAVVWRN